MDRLKGKVAIVTGAGRRGGIGLAVCEAFLRQGAAGVIATDVLDADAAAITAQIDEAFGSGRFKFVKADATAESGWSRVVDAVTSSFGALDVLINNAGVGTAGGLLATSLDDLRRTMAINHDALFLGIKACAPLLADAVTRFPGGGAVVNNLSMASFMPNANNFAYHVSKAAGRMLTICAATELGPQKIRVNSVNPGVTMTPMIRQGIANYVQGGVWPTEEIAEAALTAMSPLNTTGQPEDAAHAFVYLASEEARFVTGAALYHDGGLGMRY